MGECERGEQKKSRGKSRVLCEECERTEEQKQGCGFLQAEKLFTEANAKQHTL